MSKILKCHFYAERRLKSYEIDLMSSSQNLHLLSVLQCFLVSILDLELLLGPSGILMDSCKWVPAAVQEQ